MIGGEMIKAILPLIGLGVIIFLMATGCAGPSRVAMDYGTSHSLARFNQILNPEAEKNLEPAKGFDGHAAQASMERYRKGFERAAPSAASAPIFGIRGITTGTGMGSGY
jgi:hypothetical protein